MTKLIFIFIDGIGIGLANSSNPFFAGSAEYFPLYEGGCVLPDSTPIKAIDACLGIEGMPMSATGQTTLFCGTNVPALLHEHRDSYPDAIMRQIIKKKNIFSALRQYHINPCFLNAFPGNTSLFSPYHIQIREDGEFQSSVEFQHSVKRSLSVTTCMMIANHMVPFSDIDIKMEKSLFHDFTNLSLHSKHCHLPIFSPEKAAEIMYNASQHCDVLLYEFFQTDFYGHGFEMHECIELIHLLNRLIKHLISLLDSQKETLLVTSDHGNLEDMTTPLHTFNPVPLLTWGYRSQMLRDRINNLADVSPAILEMFTPLFNRNRNL